MLFADDIHAQFDTFIADEHGRTSNQLADLMLAFPQNEQKSVLFSPSSVFAIIKAP